MGGWSVGSSSRVAPWWLTTGLLVICCLVPCQTHAAETSSQDESQCAESDILCTVSGAFLRPDTRCWVTCRGQVEGQAAVGGSSYCQVTDGPAVGVYKCKEGRWFITGLNQKPLKRVKRFWRRRRRRRSPPPPPPNQPPYFTSCPTGGVTSVASSGKTTSQVTWSVAAADPNGGAPSVTQTQGPPPNSVFNEGATTIRYTARDSGGLTATCVFTVTVTVYRCSSYQTSSFLHGSQSCSGVEKNVYGSVCSHSCDTGYVLLGAPAVTCTSSSTWDTSFPTCLPISCGDPGSVSGGHVMCPEGHVFTKGCVLQCHSGYRATGVTSVTCDSAGQWSSRLGPCTDIEAPKFPNGCPADQQLYSGPLESPVAVTWSDPVATDNSGQTVTLSSDLAKGSLLGLGSRIVTVTARDLKGNEESCQFVVTVQARKCQPLPPPSDGQVICTRENVEGSECSVTCNLGYQLQGTATLECLNTQLWSDSPPTCEAILCSQPTVQHGVFECPSGLQNPAVCSLTCDPGFTVVDPKDIRCLENATWSVSGYCYDVESPQFSNGCPRDLAVDAAPLGSDTTVSWSPPDVTDNSGDVVNLQSDVIPGSTFPSGVTNVTYTAVDVTGNTAACAFSVTVTVLSCADPSTNTANQGQGQGQGRLNYSCADGHVYGATCTVNCSHGYSLVGEDVIRCGRDNSTHPPSVVWQWAGGQAGKPICREDRCPPLQPPKNGALSCHLGDYGPDCLMTCDASWDIPVYTRGFFYCLNDAGSWMPSGRVPDCVVRMLPTRVRLQTQMFYLTGSCNASVEKLRESFVTRLSSSLFKDACVNVPSCSASNVEVMCGPRPSVRGKRGVASHLHRALRSRLQGAGRSLSALSRSATATHYVLVDVEIRVPYEERLASPEKTYRHYQAIRTAVQQSLRAMSEAPELDTGHLKAADDFTVGLSSQLLADCPPGTALRSDHRFARRLSCAGCSKGHFLAVNSTVCLECPVGSYSEVDSATSCTPCPFGLSTTGTGSQHSSQCRP